MTTIPAKDFFGGGQVTVVGNETSSDYKKSVLQPPEEQQQQPGGGFLKSLVSAPATILARPVQAAQDFGDYLGTRIEENRATTPGAKSAILNAEQQRATQNQTQSSGPGGIIAPTPANGADLKKDVARAAETVALGMGPVSGGALFGAANSVEQGNDLASLQTIYQAALGAGAGKILQLVGKPILNASGKVMGKITPQFLSDIAAQGSKAVEDFAAAHDILPDFASKAINNSANAAENIANKPFEVAGNTFKDTVGAASNLVPASMLPKESAARQARVIAQRNVELAKLENNNASIRKVVETAKSKGIDVKDIVSNTDLLHNSVDSSGTIRTTNPGGAVEQLTHFIQPQEDVISQTLQREGKMISFSDLEKQLNEAVNNSSVKGGAKLRAQQNVKQDIQGYLLDAVDSNGKPWIPGKSVGEPQIPLSTVHDAKVDKYSNIDYTNPESKKIDKVIAKTLKQIVENNTDSVDVKKLNEELSKHYATLNFLEKLDGRKVDGGKLGKYFAQTIGGMVGSHFGPLGTIAGAEVGGLIKGAAMKGKFGTALGKDLEQSPAMREAIAANVAHSNSLGNRNSAQSSIIPPTRNTIPNTVPQKVGERTMPVYNSKKPLTGGFVKIGDASKIHPDDLASMSDFTDYAAGSYKPSAAEARRLELDASRLWEHYFPNKKMPKTVEGVANEFGRVLEKNNFGKDVQPRDEAGRFTSQKMI